MLALTLLAGAALAGLEPEPGKPTAAPGGWTPLFNGRNLDGWYTFLQEHGKNSDPDRVITIEDGSIRLYKHANDGQKVVMGYISTQKEYGNYHLRFQYRWGTKKFEPRYKLKRDAGLYYHLNGPDLIWPRGLQYQIEQTNVGDLITLLGFEVDTWTDPKTVSDPMPTFLDPEHGGKPRVMGGAGYKYQKHIATNFENVGWNTVEIIAKGDTITHLLNGHLVNQAQNVRFSEADKPGKSQPVTRGRIAIEIEAAEIDFRRVEIQMLEPSPGQKEQ